MGDGRDELGAAAFQSLPLLRTAQADDEPCEVLARGDDPPEPPAHGGMPIPPTPLGSPPRTPLALGHSRRIRAPRCRLPGRAIAQGDGCGSAGRGMDRRRPTSPGSSASWSGSTSNTNLPMTSAGSSPVSRPAARLNTTMRPTSSATTTPSGSSSAKTRLPIGTGPSGSGLMPEACTVSGLAVSRRSGRLRGR